MKRLVVSGAAAALGICLGASAFALSSARGAGAVRNGGTFRIDLPGIDSVDPALAYGPQSWLLLEATCAKLMNSPDRPLPAGLRVVPEVAARYRISNDGRTYTFTLKRSFRFDTGARVTAASFARSIDRLLDPAIDSPAVGYVQDIVGADRVLDGKASAPAGVVARRYTLVIRLTKRVPDMLARLTMPFFCAVPRSLPSDPEGVGAYPSAGPYYIGSYVPGERVVLRRNRFYHGGRPHHVGTFVVDLAHTGDEILPAITSGAADWGYVRATYFAARYSVLKRLYGLNRSRFWSAPGTRVNYFVLNTQSALFRGNPGLRRAVNFAVDRRALAGAFGHGGASPTDQYLPTGSPGFRDAHIYPFSPNLRKARARASGHLRAGKAVLYTRSDLPVAVEQAQIVKANLARIGLRVEIKAIPSSGYGSRLATPGEPFDIAWLAWAPDYADPYSVINSLLDGRQIALGPTISDDFAHFDSRPFNRRMERASRLSGAARYRAYARLDAMLARDAAPMIAFANGRELTFVSGRVGCVVVRPDLDLAAVCLKR